MALSKPKIITMEPNSPYLLEARTKSNLKEDVKED